jgi:hypothetical protein
MSEMHKCENPSCNNSTANPRFCCRSCSAAVTNLSHPKRKPEHHCRKCNALVRSGKTYCVSCLEASKAEQDQARTYTKSYFTLDGEAVQRPIVKASVSKWLVFKTTFFASRLDSKSSIGELIEHLIGICFSAPEYLRVRDAACYTSLLHELKLFKVRQSWERDSPVAAVANLPLRSLSHALEEWVFFYFGDDQSQLMPHYALDTARFMKILIQGTYGFAPEAWELEPIFGREIADLNLFRFLDAQFKRRFTELIDLEVIARVPKGASILYREEILFAEDAEFVFRVRRCHLSESVYENSILHIQGDAPKPRFDIGDEFRLRGHIVPQGSNSPSHSYDFSFDLPPMWITHEVRYDDRGRGRSLIPVPKFAGEPF